MSKEPAVGPTVRSTVPSPTCDVAVVGAGLVGLATARALLARRPGLRVVVLERGATLAPHQSSHNSGVVHAGIYYAPGSLKARLAVSGARALYDFCAAHDVAHERCGKVIVATDTAELPGLDELERRGRANGVPNLRRIAPDELARIEPHCRGVAALHSPHTGIVDYAGVARALAADVEMAGGTICLGAGVDALTRLDGRVALEHAAGRTVARRVITCAGAWADELAPSHAGLRDDDVRIVPFRGAYRTLRPERAHLVRALIYPVPDPELPFLGVHLTRGIDGEVHAGPTALLVGARDAYSLRRIVPADVRHVLGWPGTWRMMRRWWHTGLTELHHAARPAVLAAALARYVPELEPHDLLPGPAGVRGQAIARDGRLLDDFLVETTDVALHVRNAPSPAATACLALGELIADRAEL